MFANSIYENERLGERTRLAAREAIKTMIEQGATFVCAFLLLAFAGCAQVESGNTKLLRSAGLPVSPVAELPRVFVDTTMPVQNGKTHKVTECSQVQSAINAAEYGDTVEVAASLTCYGSILLPEKKAGAGWIVIQSSALAELPSEGTRIDPARHSQFMPRFISRTNNNPALRVELRAHHYRVIGIEFAMDEGTTTTNTVVNLDRGARTVSEYPSHLVIDRCYIHGSPKSTVRRGVQIGGAHIAIIDSYVSEIHDTGTDTQAICGWNFPGPLKIVNNYLEAAGENINFGGSDPVVDGVVPSDIEIRRNHIYKPLRWWPRSPEFAGIRWLVKNSFEVKNAQRVLFEGNVVENNWAGGQVGFMVLLKAEFQSNKVPQAICQDITIRYNKFAHSASWINSNWTSSGDTGEGPASPPDVVCTPGQNPRGCIRVRRFNIHDNLAVDISAARWGGNGRILQILGPTDDVIFEHNTAFHEQELVLFGGPGPQANPNRFSQRFVFRNNLVTMGAGGVKGAGTATGVPTLEFHAPGYSFVGNVLVGYGLGSYPGKNSFAGEWKQVKFVDIDGGNYRLAPESKFRKASTDGRDPGADMDALEIATAGVVAGTKPPNQ